MIIVFYISVSMKCTLTDISTCNHEKAPACWPIISNRFTSAYDCCAAYFAYQAAEVLERLKPADLIPLPNRRCNKGLTLYEGWQHWGEEIARASALETITLANHGTHGLLLIFRRELLAAHINAKKTQAVLSTIGYPKGTSLDMLLAALQDRFQRGECPHEIGILLGYPLKDVIGFMGIANIPFTCQGPWKIYGCPQESIKLAHAIKQCRSKMVQELASCTSPLQCLSGNRHENVMHA